MGVLSQILYFAVHPNQFKALIQWLMWHKPAYTRDPSKESATLKDCFKWLKMTSRSFAMVVQELNPDLVLPVVLYYLVLRGLDTIEDDMTISLEEKEPLLRNFETILEKDGWTYDKNGPNEKDRELLVHFDDVITEFKLIDPKHRDIIKDIAHKMGNGMADYANNAKHNINSVNTIEEYELYCHYVAGLVGDGLTTFFVEGGFANPTLSNRPDLTESMGQFLQKANIIRDVREDFIDQRRFWPKEIWSKHVDKFDDLFDPKHQEAALTCSSEMVLNSLRHAEECLFYMAGINEQGVFNFVAIPQAMAIATLELVFQNPRIFEANVKITKGDAAQLLIESSQNLRTVCVVFKRYVRRIQKKNNPKDPNFSNISIACGKVEQFIESIYPSQDPKVLAQLARDSGSGLVVIDKNKSIADQAKSDVFYHLLTVLGTLFFISVIMVSRRSVSCPNLLTTIKVGIAYWARARFDVAFRELIKGNIFPNKEHILDPHQGNVIGGPPIAHGEL
ncbi:isoprenoid synthase domain-containing protein [Amylocarpus encephaloides]|uniref:squalene synthase n=1 Tax=Amylocarpus encephaloides TaxID=45428 RepID=A0A9P7Y8W1_9HELO|nr:isoprenoid synthase domain-containing protein [Amylocarpus encephaloides]